jgi:hypothetical protein
MSDTTAHLSSKSVCPALLVVFRGRDRAVDQCSHVLGPEPDSPGELNTRQQPIVGPTVDRADSDLQ